MSKSNFAGWPRKHYYFWILPVFPSPLLKSSHLHMLCQNNKENAHPVWNNSDTNTVAVDKFKGTIAGPMQGQQNYPELLEEKDGSRQWRSPNSCMQCGVQAYMQIIFPSLWATGPSHGNSKCRWNQEKHCGQSEGRMRLLKKKADPTQPAPVPWQPQRELCGGQCANPHAGSVATQVTYWILVPFHSDVRSHGVIFGESLQHNYVFSNTIMNSIRFNTGTFVRKS